EKCSASCAEGVAMVTIVAYSTTISCATPSRARTAHRFGSRSRRGHGHQLGRIPIGGPAIDLSHPTTATPPRRGRGGRYSGARQQQARFSAFFQGRTDEA